MQEADGTVDAMKAISIVYFRGEHSTFANGVNWFNWRGFHTLRF